MKTGNALGGFQEFLTGILSSKLTVAPSLEGKSCKSAVTEPLYFMSKLGGAHILSA